MNRERIGMYKNRSDEADELVAFVCDEILAAFHRGELMALAHLRENATPGEAASTTHRV